MEKTFFGTLPTGEGVHLYTLKSATASLSLIDYGAKIQSFNVYGREIVGGFDTLGGYLKDTSHQGATIGRVANRIGGARFEMDGETYFVTENNNGNCLHGGVGFDYRMWELSDSGENFVSFSYVSKDGEEGFPASVSVTVTFTLTDATVIIDYKAVPDGKTPIALTNHSYFNLDGFGDTIDNHVAIIYADRYTEVDDNLIPNGNRPHVEGTEFDFRTPHKIGERVGGDFIEYDHNFVLCASTYADFSGTSLPLAATVSSSDLKLSVYTDQPGVQFYIGNFLGSSPDAPDFRGGIKPIVHGAFCLEAQTEPDCISHGIGFYGKDEVYTQKTVYKVEKIGK
jgi:aldose 1-epimerase